MAHRLQITITDEHYEWLRTMSAETGASIAELVRRSLDGERDRERLPLAERRRFLERSSGAWKAGKNRPTSGEDYVDQIRRGR